MSNSSNSRWRFTTSLGIIRNYIVMQSYYEPINTLFSELGFTVERAQEALQLRLIPCDKKLDLAATAIPFLPELTPLHWTTYPNYTRMLTQFSLPSDKTITSITVMKVGRVVSVMIKKASDEATKTIFGVKAVHQFLISTAAASPLAIRPLCLSVGDKRIKLPSSETGESMVDFFSPVLDLFCASTSSKECESLANDERLTHARSGEPLHATPFWSDLIQACCQNNAERIFCLLSLGTTPLPILSAQRITPLMIAAQFGHVEAAFALCSDKRGEDAINERDQAGETALYKAVAEANLDVVRYLMTVGADPTIANIFGESPLMRAIRTGHLEIIKLLLNDLRVRNTIFRFDSEQHNVVEIAKDASNPEIVAIIKAIAAAIRPQKTAPVEIPVITDWGQKRTGTCAAQIFFGLGHSWWKQFFDGLFHSFGPLVFDKGWKVEEKTGAIEPGYYSSFYWAAVEAIKIIHDQRSVTVEIYRHLHDLLCRHFTGEEGTGQLVGIENIKHLRFQSFIVCSLKGLIEKFNLDVCKNSTLLTVNSILEAKGYGKIVHRGQLRELPENFNYRALLSIEDLPIVDSDYHLVYEPPSGDKIEKELRTLFEEYHKTMSTLNAKLSTAISDRDAIVQEKLKAIANLFQSLEWLHPFPDGQGRADLLLLSILLCQEGFNPPILLHPYISSCTTLNMWSDELEKGMKDWRALRDYLHMCEAGMDKNEALLHAAKRHQLDTTKQYQLFRTYTNMT